MSASSYVANNLSRVSGLVLWASYPANDVLKIASIKVVSIYGSNDMGGMEPFDKSHSQLPADTKFVIIEGGNHGQFGSYGPQAGDKVATISPEEQWAQVAEATAELLKSLEN